MRRALLARVCRALVTPRVRECRVRVQLPGADTAAYDRQEMSLDPGWLLLSLIIGGAGFVLFVYGRKQERWPQLVAGLVFMVYPYFVSSLAVLVGVGVALSVGLWLAIREGW
jgi:hypothetical protein